MEPERMTRQPLAWLSPEQQIAWVELESRPHERNPAKVLWRADEQGYLGPGSPQHIASGLIAGLCGLPLAWWMLFALGWELVENHALRSKPSKVLAWLQHTFYFRMPYLGTDSIQNSITDVLCCLVGWVIGNQMRKRNVHKRSDLGQASLALSSTSVVIMIGMASWARSVRNRDILEGRSDGKRAPLAPNGIATVGEEIRLASLSVCLGLFALSFTAGVLHERNKHQQRSADDATHADPA